MTEKARFKQGFFVTGTDTGVGKTVVSAVIFNALCERRRVFYWKPVQTGIEIDDDTKMVRTLTGAAKNEILDEGIRLEKPLSPHLSARLARQKISIEKILELAFSGNDPSNEKFWIIEGAGGVFVPLNESEMMLDLIEKIDLPVVIAARSGLGTINHTLLTLAALRSRNAEIAGVVMSGNPSPENKAAIEQFGKTLVLAQIPELENISRRTLEIWKHANPNAFDF